VVRLAVENPTTRIDASTISTARSSLPSLEQPQARPWPRIERLPLRIAQVGEVQQPMELRHGALRAEVARLAGQLAAAVAVVEERADIEGRHGAR